MKHENLKSYEVKEHLNIDETNATYYISIRDKLGMLITYLPTTRHSIKQLLKSTHGELLNYDVETEDKGKYTHIYITTKN